MKASIAHQDARRARAGPGRTGISETPPRRPLRTAIAESSYLIREFLTDALSSAAQVELVAVCCNCIELESAIATWRPDVVLTDVRMPTSTGDEGIRIAKRLRETDPHTGVIVFSEHAEPTCALALLAGGSRSRAYLLKQRARNRRELIRAIEAVARGDSVIDPMIFEVLTQDRDRTAQSRLSELTPRERELLAAIADSLFLTTRAVERQVSSIFAKLGLTDSEDAGRRVIVLLAFLSGQEDVDEA